MKNRAPAIFCGIQQGYGYIPDLELWTLIEPIAGYPAHTTLARQTIEAAGFILPAAPVPDEAVA